MKELRFKKSFFDKQKIIYFILSILVLCLVIVLIVQNTTKDEKIVKNPYDIEVSDMDNFVLLGDSITEFYPVEEFYDELPVINSGVSGYTTDDILEHLEQMVSIYNPTKVFLLIGTNDIRESADINKVVSNIQKIVKGIKVLRPKAEVYLESIYPVNNTDHDKIDHDMVANRKNNDIKKINKKLKSYCEKNNLTYIDVYRELVDKEGNLNIKYTEEGLHLSSLGYLRVTKVLLPYFQD